MSRSRGVEILGGFWERRAPSPVSVLLAKRRRCCFGLELELDDHWFEDRHVAFLLQSFGRLEVSYTFI